MEVTLIRYLRHLLNGRDHTTASGNNNDFLLLFVLSSSDSKPFPAILIPSLRLIVCDKDGFDDNNDDVTYFNGQTDDAPNNMAHHEAAPTCSLRGHT